MENDGHDDTTKACEQNNRERRNCVSFPSVFLSAQTAFVEEARCPLFQGAKGPFFASVLTLTLLFDQHDDDDTHARHAACVLLRRVFLIGGGFLLFLGI